MLENTLIVFNIGSLWHVDWKHTPEAEYIRGLFGGTTATPTPFNTLTAVSEVIATVKARNPQYKVVAASENGLALRTRERGLHVSLAADSIECEDEGAQ